MNRVIKTGFGKIYSSGQAEREKLMTLLDCLKKDKITKLGKYWFNFEDFEVYFNIYSGLCFLSDDDYNSLIYNSEKNKLDLWIVLPESGEEGFYEDLKEYVAKLSQEDLDYLQDIQEFGGN